MGTTTKLSVTIDKNLLRELETFVEEQRKNGIMKPKRIIGVKNPTVSRSQVVSAIIEHVLSEWKRRKREEQQRKMKQTLRENSALSRAFALLPKYR